MKSLALIFFLFVAATSVRAQQAPAPVAADTTIDNETDSTDVDKEFTAVDIEAKFPGGTNAWRLFLQKNLHTDVPVKNKAPKGRYTVLIQFLVDKQGNVSDLKILEDPGYGCADEVLRIFKKSPAWVPAVQHGRNVIFHQKQAITFLVE